MTVPGSERPGDDHDVVVVGSGFGGSVAALRLTEKGYRVRPMDDAMSARLWEESVRLTGVDYDALSTSGTPGS